MEINLFILQIGELKLCEIELKHLKVSSSEQRRNLRQVTRLYEELQVNVHIHDNRINSVLSFIYSIGKNHCYDITG